MPNVTVITGLQHQSIKWVASMQFTTKSLNEVGGQHPMNCREPKKLSRCVAFLVYS